MKFKNLVCFGLKGLLSETFFRHEINDNILEFIKKI